MKKILHISNYYYPYYAGREQTAKDCVNSLKDNYENKVICFNDKNYDCVDNIDKVEIIRCRENIKISSQPISFSYPKLLKKTIHSYKPNIIIFHYPNPFVAHFLLRIIPDDCKLVLYWHLDIIKQKILGKLFYKQNEKLLKRANKIIATSENYIKGSRWLTNNKNKCVVINSCINEKRLEINDKIIKVSDSIKKENEGKTICIAIGRHVKYKGFEYLIKACNYLDESFRIYFVGEGKLTKKLKEEAKNDSKIQFLGSVSDETLKAFLLASDILCFPSITKNEAFGLALAEGMYYGKPGVTFTIPGSGVNYVCPNGVTGLEVENKDYVQYANALKQLSYDVNMRNKLGENAKQYVIDNFMYKKYSIKIQNLIEEMLLNK